MAAVGGLGILPLRILVAVAVQDFPGLVVVRRRMLPGLRGPMAVPKGARPRLERQTPILDAVAVAGVVMAQIPPLLARPAGTPFSVEVAVELVVGAMPVLPYLTAALAEEHTLQAAQEVLLPALRLP